VTCRYYTSWVREGVERDRKRKMWRKKERGRE